MVAARVAASTDGSRGEPKAARRPHDYHDHVGGWLLREVKAGRLDPEPTSEQLAAVAGILLDAEVVANRA